MMSLEQEAQQAKKICDTLLSCESAWDEVADSELSKRVAYYQAVKIAFTSSPLRQPLLQERVIGFIDKRLSELVTALLGPDFKNAVQIIIEEVEQQEG